MTWFQNIIIGVLGLIVFGLVSMLALIVGWYVTPILPWVAAETSMVIPKPTDTPTHTLRPTTTPTPKLPTTTPTLELPSQTPVPTEKVYNVVEVGTIRGPSSGIASIALSPVGSIVAYGNYSDNSVHLVDASTGEVILTLKGHTAPVSELAFSPDGYLLASTGTINLPPAKDGTVRIWDVKTGEQLAVFETSGINQLAFSPDGTIVAGVGVGDPIQVTLWDVETFSEKRIISGGFTNISFSPNGNLLAFGNQDELVHILDFLTGEEVMSFSGHKGRVEAVAFSPNGEILASGSEDTTIRLWEAKTGKRLKFMKGHKSMIELLAFSPDGSILASLGSGVNVTPESDGGFWISVGPGDQVVRLWDIKIGQQIGLIEVTEGINDVSFNTDWTRIATGGNDGVIRLWDVRL